MFKISVIIPIYNVQKYLKECLNSVVSQTLKEIEIICVDDGSTDGSPEILKEYAQKDKRVKIISQENQGQGHARNVGLACAKGEYITFVDSDDYLDIDGLEKLYDNAVSQNVDVVWAKINVFEGSNIIKNKEYFNLHPIRDFKNKVFTPQDVKDVRFQICVCPCSKLYKKSFLDENNIIFPTGIIFEDNVFFMLCLKHAKTLSILDEGIYYYRINRIGSTMSASLARYEDMFKILDMVEEIIVEDEQDKKQFEIFKAGFVLDRLKKAPKRDFLLRASGEFYKMDKYVLECPQMKKEFEMIKEGRFSAFSRYIFFSRIFDIYEKGGFVWLNALGIKTKLRKSKSEFKGVLRR